jgi:hypothetical protein
VNDPQLLSALEAWAQAWTPRPGEQLNYAEEQAARIALLRTYRSLGARDAHRYHYLASPYTHFDPEVMEYRFRAACNVCDALNQAGLTTYSPIVHCHPIAKLHRRGRTVNDWWGHNKALLSSAASLVVLQIFGWDASQGIQKELGFAKANRIPWTHLGPQDDLQLFAERLKAQ